MAAVGEGADGKSVNGALLGGELFGFATRNGFGALLEFITSLLTIPRVVEDGGVEHVLPIGFSDFLLIVLELFFILAIGIEAKGAACARNCFTNFIHPGGGRSCMEMKFALGYYTFL